jgi:hypothetical protein
MLAFCERLGFGWMWVLRLVLTSLEQLVLIGCEMVSYSRMVQHS